MKLIRVLLLFTCSPTLVTTQHSTNPTVADYPSIQAALDANPGSMVSIPVHDHLLTNALVIRNSGSGLYGLGPLGQANTNAAIIEIRGAANGRHRQSNDQLFRVNESHAWFSQPSHRQQPVHQKRTVGHRDNEGWGLFVDGATRGTMIRGNTIEDSGSGKQKTGIRLGKKTGEVRFEDNTIKADKPLLDERKRWHPPARLRPIIPN